MRGPQALRRAVTSWLAIRWRSLTRCVSNVPKQKYNATITINVTITITITIIVTITTTITTNNIIHIRIVSVAMLAQVFLMAELDLFAAVAGDVAGDQAGDDVAGDQRSGRRGR